ncbi:MAG: glycosyltransferase [Betaproteobacteria bacterium HGW-Betaproteobacteria-13]|nr:MAG: glycosyltransferase [Betaproteobacteria bacterium HGW-Betaproteobacteria-19]PKO81515.1 MAG: glycosyltransferase [Betaproteobacteria bacterium HGW-Betaproteobacteria-13]
MTEARILQFCHCHYGPFRDVARQYATLFRDTPYKVTTVYLTDPPNAEVEAGSASDEVIFLDYDGKDVRGLKLDAMRRLRQIVAERDIRLVIAHRFKPIYISCWATKLPVIGVHHAFGDYERLSHQLFARWFGKRLGLLGVSDAIRDDIRRGVPSWPEGRIETLHNRIDVETVRAGQIAREAARERLGLPADAFIVGNVGRLHPDKDQATLLRAFARALPQLPAEAQLVILGKGRLERTLRAQVESLGIAGKVRFLGQVPQAWQAFAAFDVFALSSDHEPFGMVLLEAMAAGVPVIATNCGGAPEVVGEVGSLFPLGDDAELARLLVEHAGWSVSRKEACAHASLTRLREAFSDEAARRRFFALPMVRDVLGDVCG